MKRTEIEALRDPRMMNWIFFLLLLLCSFSSFGQTSSPFDANNYNQGFLEHLVKTKIDAVRAKYDCEPLVNDSILFIASTHHANYMERRDGITHMEKDSSEMITPQNRAEYFGAVNYNVGENVLFMPFNSKVKSKTGKVFNTNTYEELADAIVAGWVNSPGHFKNMITPDYQITGLSLVIDPEHKRIYACQKFATVFYKYDFEENKEMFSYSEYVPTPPVTSFDGIDNQLIDHDYAFKLKHDKLEECQECLDSMGTKPFLSLRIDRKNFILRVENSNFVKNMMDERRDGFAVEIVTFDDYMCGNPEYYTRPSRRNGQLKVNGRLLEPVYRKDLVKGYKKRKRRKDVKFVSYIFKADSVAFFKRFGRYKLDRHNFQYFEIKLGRIPKDIDGMWTHNLIYIQNKQICHIDYFTAYCGDLYEEYEATKCMTFSADGCYEFPPEQKELTFTIPFQQGESEFTNAQIAPFISSLENLSYSIDSIQIDAYSSIEGNLTINENLQRKRANSIASILRKYQPEEIAVVINTKTDWDGFYAAIRKNRKWAYLAENTSEEVTAELDRLNAYGELETLLSKERRGIITMSCTIDDSDKNLEYFINKELSRVNSILNNKTSKSAEQNQAVKDFNKLYTNVHCMTVEKRVEPSVLASIQMYPDYYQDHVLVQKYILYGYEFEDAFQANKHWVDAHLKDQRFIITDCTEHIKPEYVLTYVSHLCDIYIENETANFKNVQAALSALGGLDSIYKTNADAAEKIDRLNFNLNMLLINYVYDKNPLKYSGNAIRSLAQINEYYVKHDKMTGSIAVNLAKIAVKYQNIQQAVNILYPYTEEDSVMAYMMPLGYDHPSRPMEEYYTELVDLSETMDPMIWCNMFMGQCMIPFQALDDEALRNVFCEKCMNRNEIILQLLGKIPLDTL